MEVIMTDGSISTDIDTVLNNWKTYFNSFFNNMLSGSTGNSNHVHHIDTVLNGNLPFNKEISIVEVKNAIDEA